MCQYFSLLLSLDLEQGSRNPCSYFLFCAIQLAHPQISAGGRRTTPDRLTQVSKTIGVALLVINVSVLTYALRREKVSWNNQTRIFLLVWRAVFTQLLCFPNDNSCLVSGSQVH